LKSKRKRCLSHPLQQKLKSCPLHQEQRSCPLRLKLKNNFLKLHRKNQLHQNSKVNSSRICEKRYEKHCIGSSVAILGCVEYNPFEVEVLHDPTQYLFTGHSSF